MGETMAKAVINTGVASKNAMAASTRVTQWQNSMQGSAGKILAGSVSDIEQYFQRSTKALQVLGGMIRVLYMLVQQAPQKIAMPPQLQVSSTPGKITITAADMNHMRDELRLEF